MRKENLRIMLLFIMLPLLFACGGGQEKNKRGELIHLPSNGAIKKQTLFIEDIADVTYLRLASNDSCLMKRHSMLHLSDDKMVIRDFINGAPLYYYFDGEGNWLYTLDKKGGGPDEYQRVTRQVYNYDQSLLLLVEAEKKQAMLYNDRGVMVRKDSFLLGASGDQLFYSDNLHYLFRESNLPFYQSNFGDGNEWLKEAYSVFKIDASTGEVMDSLMIPKKVHFKYTILDAKSEGGVVKSLSIYKASHHYFFKDGGDLLISDIVADTIYRVDDAMVLHPWAVKEQDSEVKKGVPMLHLQSVFPGHIFYSAIELGDEKKSFTELTYYLYDRKSGETTIPTLSLREYQDLPINVLNNLPSDQQLSYFFLTYDQLSEAMEKDQLSGELLEIAQAMTEDDNPLLVKIRFK